MKKMAAILMGIAMAAAIPAAGLAADVNVNVSTGQPAVAAVAEPAAEMPPPLEVQNPEMVVVPSGNSYVYMVPNVYGVYFNNGYWFRYYNGVWFRSTAYNSGWVVVRRGLVPGVVLGVYPEYSMYLPAGYFRIGWGDFRTHWRGWGYGHWNRQPWFKHEMRSRAERHRHIERQRSDWSHGRGHGPAGYHSRPAGHGPASRGSAHKAAPHGGKTAPHHAEHGHQK